MLKRFRWFVQGVRLRLTVQRSRDLVRKSAASDPVKTRIVDLCIAADDRGIDALTARQQLVVRTWSAHGIIGNGGFRYFFEGTAPLGPVAEGYRTLGFDAAASACEAVAGIVAAVPHLTEKERREAVRAASGHDRFDGEESAVYDVSWEALQSAIGRYMRLHPRDFPGIPGP